MREEIKGDEVSMVDSIATRDRKLRPSFSRDEPPKPDPAPEEPSEAVNTPLSEEPTKDAPRKDTKRRRGGRAQDYKSLFVKEVAGSKARVNKVVYIRKEHHERILKVVQIIGRNEVSLFSFLDNLLEHHFSTWQGELTELYESSFDKKF